jgi:cytochrome P450
MSAPTLSEALTRTIVDPVAYQANTPIDEAFAEIRRDAPMAMTTETEYAPFWVVSRHADVMEVERQGTIFFNEPRPTVVSPKESEGVVRFLTGGEANLIRSLVSIDGAEHKAIRGVVFPAMTPAAVRKMEGQVRDIAQVWAQDMIDRAPECDFAEEVAFWYPLRVIMTVLGVPQEDEPYLMKLTQELFSAGDPELNRNKAEVTPAEALQQLVQTNADLEAYFADVTKRFRSSPDDSKINSLIANATIDGDYLNHRQIMGFYIIAATAGHDTTSNTTASAMASVAERPDLLARLQADPSLMGQFVDESIRWATPVKHFMRTAMADVEVAGQQVRQGDWLMLPYQSANRDEAAFDAPFDFNIDRKPNRHVAFGYGPHVCVGQHLAKMEMRLLWEELLPKLSSLELTAPPELTRSNFVCGPKHVHVRFGVK